MKLFEIKVNYERQTGEDNPGLVRETYLVDSVNPSNAETILMDELKPLIFGGLEVEHITNRNFFEIFTTPEADSWYKARVELLTIDGEKESRRVVSVMVQANTISDALQALKEKMAGYDCEILSVAKTPVLDLLKA